MVSPPPPNNGTTAAAPLTAKRATSDVAAANLPRPGLESPIRTQRLFPSSSKRGKPKTTPERGCESPQKKKGTNQQRQIPCVSSNFNPVLISRGPSPVSVAPPSQPQPKPPSKQQQKKKQQQKNARNQTKRAKKDAPPPLPSKPKAPAKPRDVFAINRREVMTTELHTWSRTSTFDPNSPKMDKAIFDSWEDGFQRQMRVRFRKVQAKKKDLEESLGLGLRSALDEDVLIDEDAYTLSTTDAKRLSRMHWEDILRVKQGDQVVVYFRKDKDLLRNDFADIPTHAAKEQKKQGIGGEVTRLNGSEFYVLRATMFTASFHLPAVSGQLNLKQLMKHFDDKDGFVIDFGGKERKVMFSWQEMISYASDVYFFGAPVNGVRNYGRLFRSVWTEPYARQIYYDIAQETAGDAYSSMALANAYKECIIGIQAKAAREKEEEKEELLEFNETKQADKMFDIFDNLCRRSLMDTVVQLKDTNQPIVDLKCFDAFIVGDVWKGERQPSIVERCIPRLWAHMCNLRNVKGNRSEADKPNIVPRMRQVFIQILMLRRMRNSRKLKWWAMIQSLAFFGWGVGRSALNATTFFGATVHSTTRDECLAKLCEKLVERRTKYLSSFTNLTNVLDNYQKGRHLKNMRGGRSSVHLSGTNAMVMQPCSYSDSQFDGLHVNISYTTDQDYPSPVMMPPYNEKKAEQSTAQFLLNHKNMPSSDHPCMNGGRARAFDGWKDDCRYILLLNMAFKNNGIAEEEPFSYAPDNLDKSILSKMAEVFDDSSARAVVAAAASFTRDSCRKTYPEYDKVTVHNHLGMVPLDEDTGGQTGALLMDISAKIGHIAKDENGKWAEGPNAKSKETLVVGDVKTADNIDKFFRDMKERPPSAKSSSEVAEIYSKVSEHIMIRPGDWHGGLTMVQSVNNVFWDGFLEHFKNALKWKRCTNDTRNCYYNNSSLQLMTHNGCATILMHTFVSENYESLLASFESDETDQSMVNFVCYIAKKFSVHVQELRSSDDEWLRACSFFFLMTKDLFAFIEAYRAGDAIGIEMGYQNFVAVWRALGQTRYEERHWCQLEQMLLLKPFHFLEWVRRSITVNPYHGSEGKNRLPYDEILELANRMLAQFPMVRDRDAFSRQANYLALSKMSKRLLSDDDLNRSVEPQLDEPEKTETRKDDDRKFKKFGFSRFMLDDIWVIGEKRLEKANLKEARRAARARADRKSRINCAITQLVRNGRLNRSQTLSEVAEVEMPQFMNRMIEQYPEYY